MTHHYPGSRQGQEWHDLWNVASSIDMTLELAHRSGGCPGLCQALDADDRIEHWLSRIGAQVAYLRSGDRRVLDHLQSGRAPGDSELLPEWAIDGARSESKSLYLQQGRVKPGSAKQEG